MKLPCFNWLNNFNKIVGGVRFNSSLVIVEAKAGSYSPTLLNAVTAAKKLNSKINCVVIGENSAQISKEVGKISGIEKVFYKDSPQLKNAVPEVLAPMIHKLGQNIGDLSYIIAASSSFSKNLVPRVAAHFMVSPASDIVEILDEKTFVRPIYAGNAFSKIEMMDKLKIITIRPTVFSPEKSINSDTTTQLEELTTEEDLKETCETAKWISESLSQSDLPQLSQAKIVVAGGRALKSKENFELLYKLAKKINAAVGASRAAVDAGFCPNDLQIGQTGQVVAPELYFAFGISGAIQHVAGMKDSKVIVCVNSDPECPMFEISDYSLVGDLFKVIPELEKAVSQ